MRRPSVPRRARGNRRLLVNAQCIIDVRQFGFDTLRNRRRDGLLDLDWFRLRRLRRRCGRRRDWHRWRRGGRRRRRLEKIKRNRRRHRLRLGQRQRPRRLAQVQLDIHRRLRLQLERLRLLKFSRLIRARQRRLMLGFPRDKRLKLQRLGSDPVALADGICEALSITGASDLRRHVMTMSVDAVTERLVEIYHELLSIHRCAS